MKGKNLAVLLVLMLLLGWLAASSISSFQELVPSSTGTGGGTSGSGGASSGRGSTVGTGGNGGGSGGSGGSGGLDFGFPFNLNFTGGFHLPRLNLSLPKFNIPFPKLNFSGFKFPFKFGSFNFSNLSLGKNGTGQSSSSGGGSSGTNNNPTQPTHVTPLHIDPTILIALLVAISALISIIIVRQVVTQRRDKKPEENDSVDLIQVDAPSDEHTDNQDNVDLKNIGPHEKTVPYSGWDPGNGLIAFTIDGKLPLVWEKSTPLAFTLAKGAKLREPDLPEAMTGDSLSYVPVQTCTLFNAKKLTLEDRLWLRAVSYENEIRRLFLLNFSTGVDNFKNMTSREIMRKILKENKTVKDEEALETLITTYERTFYGKKKPNRTEFESYMLSMHTALEEARIIICADD